MRIDASHGTHSLDAKRQKAHAYLKSGPAHATLMATLHTGILTADPGEKLSEQSPGPELRNNFCPVKNLSGAFDLTLSFSLALIIYARARVFKEYRLWREKEREVGVFFPLLVTPASQPPTRLSNSGKNIKKRSGDAESFA